MIELNTDTLYKLQRAMSVMGMATDESVEAFGARIESNLLDLCRFIENLAERVQMDRIIKLEKESSTKGQLITAQLALAEERNARITELETELITARETISNQDGELGKLRRLLGLDEE